MTLSLMVVSENYPDYLTFVQCKASHREVGMRKRTHIDELDFPDLLHQLHGGVAIDEEGLGVVSQLQRLQPLRHRRGVIAIITDRPHLQERDAGQRCLVSGHYSVLKWNTEPRTEEQQHIKYFCSTKTNKV